MMVVPEALREGAKKARYVTSFMRQRLVHVNLQLLYTCNFRCQICDYWKAPFRDAPRLSAEQVGAISRKLAEVGPQVVSIGGGEPLLHPEIVEVVERLAEHHFPVMICNGWFITPERARALWRAGMYEISVSVDYLDPEKHDAQRGVKGAHERALRALRLLHENRTRSDQRVHMISVIMDDNLDEIEALIQLSRGMGITYLLTLYSDGRGTKHNRHAERDVSAHLLRLKSRYPEFVALRDYMARFTQAIREGGIAGCTCGTNLVNIDSQGQVSLCIDRMDEPVGSILEEPLAPLLARLQEKQRRSPCAACWTSCRGAIETIMHGPHTLDALRDYWQLTKRIPLTARG